MSAQHRTVAIILFLKSLVVFICVCNHAWTSENINDGKINPPAGPTFTFFSTSRLGVALTAHPSPFLPSRTIDKAWFWLTAISTAIFTVVCATALVGIVV